MCILPKHEQIRHITHSQQTPIVLPSMGHFFITFNSIKMVLCIKKCCSLRLCQSRVWVNPHREYDIGQSLTAGSPMAWHENLSSHRNNCNFQELGVKLYLKLSLQNFPQAPTMFISMEQVPRTSADCMVSDRAFSSCTGSVV